MTYKERLQGFQEKMRPLFKEKLKNDEQLIEFYRQNPKEKNELKELYAFFFNKELAGCGRCEVDATAQIITLDLNSVRANKTESEFLLFAGALLEDRIGNDHSKAMSNYNLTRELCIWHLKQSKENIKYFQKYPENWEELLVDKQEKTSNEIKETKNSKADRKQKR